MTKGIAAAVVAYALWGILPVYWKALQAVPAFEILCHRTIWSLVFVLLILTARRQWGWLQRARQDPRSLLTFACSACLLGLNWLTYIWAVNTGHIVDTSLGYFINPLISVLLGVFFLRERLRLWQGIAIGIATAGVLLLTLGYGAFPWIALTLALTFGFYGLLRKTRRGPLGEEEKARARELLDNKWLMMRRMFTEAPLAVNMPYVGEREAGRFTVLGGSGPSEEAKASIVAK